MKSLQNWSELRFSHFSPERRGYHTSFMHQGKLYIYGGYDINEGLLNNLWCLNLDNLKSILDMKRQVGTSGAFSNMNVNLNFGWEKIETTSKG